MDIAFFDLDETVVACDTSYEWIDWLILNGIAFPELQILNQKLMEEYYLGTVDIRQQVELSIKPIIGVPKPIVDFMIKTFIDQVVCQSIYPQAIAQIEWHKARGDFIVLISASSTHLVKPIGYYLGFNQSFGIEAELIESDAGIPIYTGSTTGIATFQSGKVTCINNWLAKMPEIKNKIDTIYAYSDSINDRTLLGFADNASVINPNPELKALARLNNWQVCDWQLTENES